MSLPVLLHSGMTGAPRLTPTNGSMNALLHACLVNGFNTQSVVSATASGGVVTFNYASSPGFSTLDTVSIAGASNATVNGKRRVQSASNNQVLVAIPGVPDGAVGGTITMRFAPLGWTRPYSGTGVGCYRQGGAAAHKRFVRIFDDAVAANNYEGGIRGYEHMTGVDTGTGMFPLEGTQQNANGHDIRVARDRTGNSPETQYRAWMVFGTPRFFIVFADTDTIRYGAGVTEPVPFDQVNSQDTRAFAFGDLENQPSPVDTYACALFHAGLGFTAPQVSRPVSGNYGSTAQLYLTGASSYLHFTSGAQYPSASDGGIHFLNTPFYYDQMQPSGLRGSLPGALMPFEAPFTNPSGPPAFIGQTITNVSGVSGRVMLTYFGQITNSDLGWRLDEDWGDI